MKSSTTLYAAAASLAVAGALFSTAAAANPFLVFPFPPFAPWFAPLAPPAAAPSEASALSANGSIGLTERFRRQVVDYRTSAGAGTVIIDTPNTYLYYVLGGGKAVRYGIGVGRDGFTWSGVQAISRKAEWPDWTPPSIMLQRQPYLPRFVAGGPHNPLGARAMYLGGTIYRIHGTNQPDTIGGRVSSGCIRLTNDDVIDLYSRVKVGSKVIVLPMSQRHAEGARANRG
jgi:lipoprotein-anchoring transpeptidase ErfK/SrfK